MSDSSRLSDRQVWELLRGKFAHGQFLFRDVAELSNPSRAYEFMHRAEEEGWIQSDEAGETYQLNPDSEPEEPPAPGQQRQARSPSVPREFEEWYRGTKFHLGARGSITWVSPRKKVKIKAIGGLDSVLGKLQSLFPQGGSFRVDELGRVLVKDPDHDYQIEAVGKVKTVVLDAIDRDPRDRVKPGYIWPSIYDGARYHISPDGRIWFRNPDGTRRYAKSGHESLVESLLRYKPRGGGFRVTENGRVLTLRYTLPVPEEARPQWESLSDEERNVIMAREAPGEELLIPVFICDFRGKIELGETFDIHRPWSTEEREDFFAMLASRQGGEL